MQAPSTSIRPPAGTRQGAVQVCCGVGPGSAVPGFTTALPTAYGCRLTTDPPTPQGRGRLRGQPWTRPWKTPYLVAAGLPPRRGSACGSAARCYTPLTGYRDIFFYFFWSRGLTTSAGEATLQSWLRKRLPVSGHSNPVERMGELCPGHPASQCEVSVYLVEPSVCLGCIAAAMLSECYEPSPAPMPPLRAVSGSYISPSVGLPKMPPTMVHRYGPVCHTTAFPPHHP